MPDQNDYSGLLSALSSMIAPLRDDIREIRMHQQRNEDRFAAMITRAELEKWRDDLNRVVVPRNEIEGKWEAQDKTLADLTMQAREERTTLGGWALKAVPAACTVISLIIVFVQHWR